MGIWNGLNVFQACEHGRIVKIFDQASKSLDKVESYKKSWTRLEQWTNPKWEPYEGLNKSWRVLDWGGVNGSRYRRCEPSPICEIIYKSREIPTLSQGSLGYVLTVCFLRFHFSIQKQKLKWNASFFTRLLKLGPLFFPGLPPLPTQKISHAMTPLCYP